MAEQKYLEQAKATYATLCQAFDNHKWHYEKDEEELTITCEAQSDDLPMEVTVRVDHERRAALLLSLVPFVIEEDKHIDKSIAVSVIAKVLLMDALIITFYHIICFLARQIASSKKNGEGIFLYTFSVLTM